MDGRSDILPIRSPRRLPAHGQVKAPASALDAKAGPMANQLAGVHEILEQVKDPEIPVLSIAELGILRGVEIEDETIIVTLTPTYSGCPAMSVVESDIHDALETAGYANVAIKTQLSPAWTTDWMSDSAKAKLQQYGIAPPCKTSRMETTPQCPHCGSHQVREISAFGSTACKALFQCAHCAEPFDYFKPY